MATKKNGSVADVVTALAAPIAEQLGYSLWDVEYVREGADYYLRITIDNEAGITIDDCERFSRAIDPVLDEADPITDSYHLEVSSPGVERDIKTPAHIEYCKGEKVEARLFAPLNGSRVHTGILEGMDEEGNVVLTVGETTVTIPRSAISRMTTVFEF
ncbi:MAG: ribosome maturation factor RimP [Clostridia bacterium]|nr:ribosome maturation factor RimP [Clostridia bacterium]